MKFMKLILWVFLFSSTFFLPGSKLSYNNLDAKTYVKRTLIAAGVGITCEVAFTALYDYVETKEAHLKGHSYLWMLGLYAVIYPMYRQIYPKISHLHSLYRYLIYTCIIYSGEYTGGKLLRKFIGAAPWEKYYHGKAWAIDDLIRLDYAPAWFLAASIFEETCRILDESKA